MYGDDCEIIGLNQRKPRKHGGSTGLVQFYFALNGKNVTQELLVLYQVIGQVINMKMIRLI